MHVLLIILKNKASTDTNNTKQNDKKKRGKGVKITKLANLIWDCAENQS